MRIASIAACLVSIMLASCASVERLQPLPSLQDQPAGRIVQVDPGFDPAARRESPYFVVCLGDDCPVPSQLTPIAAAPSKANLAAGLSKPMASSPVAASQPRSDSYQRKRAEVLTQYRVHFDYASAELDAEGKARLRQFVTAHNHRKRPILITGLTDSSVTGGPVGNRWLALERALAVKKELIALGYPEGKISLEAKFLCCYIDSNESPAGRRNNRRAEISLIHLLKP